MQHIYTHFPILVTLICQLPLWLTPNFPNLCISPCILRIPPTWHTPTHAHMCAYMRNICVFAPAKCVNACICALFSLENLTISML